MMMVLRRTGLDDLPLLVVLGVSASLLVWAGWGADAERQVRASQQLARAERELGAVVPVDRLANCAERVSASADAVRAAITSLKAGPIEVASVGAREVGSTATRAGVGPEKSLPQLGEDLRAEGLVVDGRPQGTWVLYDSHGRPLFRGEFGPDGAPLGQWTWTHPDGQVRQSGVFQDGQPDGLWQEWYDNGVAASTSEFDEGVQDGPATEWYPNGALRQQGTFDAGERIGLWSSWYPNGQLRARGAYDRGLRSGLWEEWHENGLAMLVATYVRGRAHGLWQSWYSNGQVKERGHFIEGRREGVWHFFDFNGGVDLRTGYYQSGRMIRDE